MFIDFSIFIRFFNAPGLISWKIIFVFINCSTAPSFSVESDSTTAETRISGNNEPVASGGIPARELAADQGTVVPAAIVPPKPDGTNNNMDKDEEAEDEHESEDKEDDEEHQREDEGNSGQQGKEDVAENEEDNNEHLRDAAQGKFHCNKSCIIYLIYIPLYIIQ